MELTVRSYNCLKRE
ncbi:DNA-directed RNA polymerase subunit alpha C-terminal domain-containing protein, partial [Streptomyces sp. NPDC048551]